MELYSALPGHRTTFRDGNLTVTPPAATTDSILILGTALDGPVMTPVRVTRPEDAEKTFGKAVDALGNPNGATLIKAFHEVWAGGGRDIRLMRISGEKAANSMLGAAQEVTAVKQMEEDLGFAKGNEETRLVLRKIDPTRDEILEIDVLANGRSLPMSAYDVNGAEITLHANVTESLAHIAVYYTFSREERVPVTEAEMIPITDDYTSYIDKQHRTRLEAPTTVYVDGVAKQEDVDYIVDYTTGIVTFTDPLAVDSKVTFDGTIIVEKIYTPNDFNENGIPYGIENFDKGAEGGPQTINLSAAPKYGTFELFANGYKVKPEAYFLDAPNKRLVLKPGYVGNRAQLTCTYTTEVTEMTMPAILVEAVNAGSIYNDVTFEVKEVLTEDGTPTGEKTLIITKPLAKKSTNYEPAMEFSSLDYRTFGDLIRAVNAHPLNNVVELSTEDEDTLTKDLLTTGIMHLSGGDDGINLSKRELYEKLGGKRDEEGNIVEFGAYDLLEHYSVDIVLPQGVYADDPVDSAGKMCFAKQLAQFCAVATMRNSETMGYLPCKPLERPTLEKVYKKVNDLVAKSKSGRFNFYMRNILGDIMYDDEGKPIDAGQRIGIVAMPSVIVSNPTMGIYTTHPCNFIAGFISSLRPEQGPTNKVLPGVVGLEYELSADQLNALTEARFITLVTKEKGITIVDGPTMALPGSDYSRITSVRIANLASAIVREVSDAYIGNGYGAAEQSAHATDIQAALDQVTGDGKPLQDFEFAIHASLQDQVLGNAVIELALVPRFELRKIKTYVSLRPVLS